MSTEILCDLIYLINYRAMDPAMASCRLEYMGGVCVGQSARKSFLRIRGQQAISTSLI